MLGLIRIFAGALALTVAAASSGVAADPYTIDVIIELTGSNAFAGHDYQTALQVYEQLANRTGGIAGRPVHFEFHDDQTNPVVAVQLANGLIVNHPAVIIGGAIVSTCAAVAALVTTGPVDYCLSPGFNPKTGGYAFAASAGLDHIVAGIIRFARLKGYRRMAVISGTDATGQASDRMTQNAMALPENKDLKIVSYEHFAPTDVSVAAQVANIKAQNADVVLSWVSGTATGTVLRSLKDAGLDLPVLTSGSNMNKTQLEQYLDFTPSQMYFNGARFFERDNLRPGALRSAIDDFFNSYKLANLTPSPSASNAWDVGKIIVEMLRKAGPAATADQLRAEIESQRSFVGMNGVYNFQTGDQHGLGDDAVIMVQWRPQTRDFVAASGAGGVPYTTGH